MFNSEQQTPDNNATHATYEQHQSTITLEESPYLPPSWEHYLDLLQDLCFHRNVLVAITAPVGAGKTTLMCQFIELIHHGDLTHSVTHSDTISSNLHICNSQQAQTCQVFANSDLDKYQLLHLLTEGFSLPPVHADSFEHQLQLQLEKIQDQPRLCLLLIDNAENLPSETLSTLISMLRQQSDNQPRLHILLFGSPHLQATLNVYAQDERYQRYLLLLPLTPFSLDETKKYIEQQSENNIFPSSDCLTNPMIETIYKLSEGIPAKINAIAPRFLLNTEQPKMGQSAAHLAKFRLSQSKIIGALVIFTLIIIGSYVLNTKSTTETPVQLASTDETTFKQEQTDAAIQSQLPKNDNGSSEQTITIDSGHASDQSTTINSITLPQNNSQNKATQATKNDLSPTTSKNLPATASNKTHFVSAPIETQEDLIPATQNTTLVSNEAVMSETNSGKNNPLPATSKKTSKLTTENASLAKIDAPDLHAKKSNAYTANENYLLHIAGDNYTIRLASSDNKALMHDLIDKHHLKYARLFTTMSNNKINYVLVYGTYSSYQAAKAEIQHLPSAIKNLHPTVSNYDTVHSQIALAHTAHDLPPRV